MAHPHLTGRGRRQFDVVQRENFGPASFGETDGFHANIPNSLFLLNKRGEVVFEKSEGTPLPAACGGKSQTFFKDGRAGAPFNAA
jgi:hypothetical protein